MACCLEYRRAGRWCWERCHVPEPAPRGPQLLPFSFLLCQMRGSALHPGHFLQCLLLVRLLGQYVVTLNVMENRESKSWDQARIWTQVTWLHVRMHNYTGASLMAQTVPNLPAVRETQVLSLGLEDPLEKETVTHSSILTWKNPWTGSLAGYSPWGHKELNSTEQSCNPDDYTVRLPWISFVSLQHCTVSVEDNL